MKKAFVFLLIATVISCKNKEEMTGKTGKGDLKSPCVSSEQGPCSHRFNPNLADPKLRPFVS
jgi:hypothetical protein